MATQRLTIATLAGDAGTAVEALFRAWRNASAPNPDAVDRFCARLRTNAATLPVLYFCEWIDRWLMGDLVPGPDVVEGRRHQVACLSPAQAVAWADRCGSQFPEQTWLAARLLEAAAWESVAEQFIVLIIREVIGPSVTDDEIQSSLRGTPEWLR